MQHASGWFLLAIALAPAAGHAADRAIVVQPTVRSSWGFVTPGIGASLHPRLAVGFWQRSSGAAKGVGANYVVLADTAVAAPMAPMARAPGAVLAAPGFAMAPTPVRATQPIAAATRPTPQLQAASTARATLLKIRSATER